MRAPQYLLALGLAFAGLLLAAACGSSDSNREERGRGAGVEGTPAVTRLRLERLVTGDLSPREIARYAPGDPDLPWRGNRDRVWPVAEIDGRSLVRIAEEKPVNVRVGGPVRTTAFDRVDLSVRIPKGQESVLRVTLYEGRRQALLSGVQTVPGTGQFETIAFPLPGIERLDLEISEVTFQLVSDADYTEIAWLRVLRERGAALLPEPGAPAELADVHGEGRRGWGVDAALGGQTTLPAAIDPGSMLHLSYMQRPNRTGDTLVVSGTSAGETRLDLHTEEPTTWTTTRLPLAPEDAGREVRFTVESESNPLAFTAVAELHVERARGAEQAPLVLLITSDTHRGDHLGRGGTPGLVRTPAIDALALRGVQFVNAFAPSNITNPSHVALMTGLSPRDTRIVGNRSPLAESATTLAEHYAAAGYATAATVSVQHIGYLFSGLGQGFDRFNGLEETEDYRYRRRDGAISIDNALRWIDERRDVPLFLWVHVFDVHNPYAAPEEFEARYVDRDDVGVAPELDPVPDVEPPAWIRETKRLQNDVRPAHGRYRAAVDHLDTELRALLEHPRVLAGLTALTSDHGESFGRHNLWWTHHGLYRDQLHVPLILAGAGLPGGDMHDHPVEMLSLGATLLELSGIDAAEYPKRAIDLTGTRPAEPRFALGYAGHKAAVSHEGWLLILTLVQHDYDRGPRSFAKGAIELFHVREDPMCDEELAAAEPERAARLKAALVAWLADADRAGLARTFNLTEEAQASLQALGYATDTESSHDGAWYSQD